MPNPVEEFLQMKKEGGWWSNVWGAFKKGVGGGAEAVPLNQSIPELAGKALPMALMGAALTAGGVGVTKGVGALRERFSKARDYQNMLEAHPALREHEAGDVQALYNSLRSMSPTMAKDPIIAGSFVRESLGRRPEEGVAVSPATAKMLADTERSLSSGGGSNPILDALRVGSFAPPSGLPRK